MIHIDYYQVTDTCKFIVEVTGNGEVICCNEPTAITGPLAIEYEIDGRGAAVEAGRAPVCTDHALLAITAGEGGCLWCPSHFVMTNGNVVRTHAPSCEYDANPERVTA